MTRARNPDLPCSSHLATVARRQSSRQATYPDGYAFSVRTRCISPLPGLQEVQRDCGQLRDPVPSIYAVPENAPLSSAGRRSLRWPLVVRVRHGRHTGRPTGLRRSGFIRGRWWCGMRRLRASPTDRLDRPGCIDGRRSRGYLSLPGPLFHAGLLRFRGFARRGCCRLLLCVWAACRCQLLLHAASGHDLQ